MRRLLKISRRLANYLWRPRAGDEPSAAKDPERKTMGRTRRKEETIEIHERLIVRTTSGSFPALCEKCRASDAILLSPEQASTVTSVPARLIYRWVEEGSIHYREVANGKLIVCVKTLLLQGNGSV
jgi:hypothetical protein